MNIEPETQPTGAARVGMEMRLVRERLGWRLADVAAELRIRLPYLEAIERGDLSALPGAAYQTGFVRTYSQALGLDGDEILRRFREQGTSFAPKAELAFLAPVPDRAVPTGALVLLCVVLVLVGYGLWYRHTEQQAQMAAQIPSVPTELAPLAVPPKPPEIVTPAKPPAAAPAPAPATQTAVTPPAAAPAAASPAPTKGPAPTATPAVTATAAPAAAPPTGAKIIMATGDTWVGVRDSKGAIILSKTLHAGDSWPVPDLPGLQMTTGNGGFTEISVDGKVGPPMGAAGLPVYRYALTTPVPGATPPTAPAATPAPVKVTPLVGGPPAGNPSIEGPANTK